MQTWGDEVYAELGVSMDFDLENPGVKKHLAEFAGERIRMINDTTQEQLRAELISGVEANEGIDDLSARVEKVFGYAEGYRNGRIARTEVIRSSNFANLEAYRTSGVVDFKQWIATPDDRTRDAHTTLGNQDPIPLDDAFKIGDDEAQFPGDFEQAENSVNCRCTVTAVVDEQPKSADVCTKEWKAYDKKAEAWEHIARKAFARGFRAQAELVLKKLSTISNSVA